MEISKLVKKDFNIIRVHTPSPNPKPYMNRSQMIIPPNPLNEPRIDIDKKPGMIKDTDRDGVSNLADCEPNNRHKQGFIHNIIKSGVDKVKTYVKDTGEAKRAVEGGRFDSEKEIKETYVGQPTKLKTAVKRFRDKEVSEAYQKALQKERIMEAQRRAKEHIRRPATKSFVENAQQIFTGVTVNPQYSPVTGPRKVEAPKRVEPIKMVKPKKGVKKVFAPKYPEPVYKIRPGFFTKH